MKTSSARTSGKEARDTGSLDAGPAYRSAADALGRAAYGECRALLASATPRSRAARATFALLEARCARMLGDVSVWESAANEAAEHHPDRGSRLEATALRAHARRRSGAAADAQRDFELVREAARSEPQSALGTPLYYLALDAWMREDYDGAEALLKRNLDAETLVPMSLSLLGWVEIKREHFARAGAHFTDVLRELRETETTDLAIAANALFAISSVASETVDMRLGRKAQREFEEFVWPETLAVDRFNCLTALRFLALLEGDLPRALVLSREAVVRAPSTAYAVIGETNGAAVSRLLGDGAACAIQLDRAWTMLRKARWGAADAEARVALSNFALEAAVDMPAEARKALTMYDSLTARESAGTSFTRDRRVRGFETMAAARVAEEQGDSERARRLFRTSLENWQGVGYDMRAALVALRLRRLTRDPAYDAAVDVVLARAPKAWFAVARSEAGDALSRVTPAEMLVLAGLLAGKTARAIATDLDRSVFTINNHTRKIFKAFGVSSRAAVVARCAEAGITPKSLERRR